MMGGYGMWKRRNQKIVSSRLWIGGLYLTEMIWIKHQETIGKVLEVSDCVLKQQWCLWWGKELGPYIVAFSDFTSRS
jgi:hypothetical protein